MVHHTKVQYSEHGPVCHLNSFTFLLNTKKLISNNFLTIIKINFFFETCELLFTSFIPMSNVLCK